MNIGLACMAEAEPRYWSVVTCGGYLGVPWRNEAAVFHSDRLAFTNVCDGADKYGTETEPYLLRYEILTFGPATKKTCIIN